MSELRPFQVDGMNAAYDFITSNLKLPNRRLYTAPTGTGKSVIMLALQERLKAAGVTAVIVTPKVEIVTGMLVKRGYDPDTLDAISVAKFWDIANAELITTPVRLKNRLMEMEGIGKLRFDAVIEDESHHTTADTYEVIDACLGSIPAVGYTATGYRGTPVGTTKLKTKWGEPVELISMRDAVAAGYMTMPHMSIAPLVDSDRIEIVNGEIRTAAAEAAYRSKLDAIVALVKNCWVHNRYDKPTMVAVPGGNVVDELASKLIDAGLPVVTVTDETKRRDRKVAFDRTVACEAVLVQIDVVSEGVDLPIRRLIDCKPTISPVRFMQQFGRITRPSDDIAEYICTCRNLELHAYLLDGLVPLEAIKNCQEVFDGPSNRSATRHLGLESVGKFKALRLHINGGIKGHMYALYELRNNKITEFCILCLPTRPEPIVASRSSTTDGHTYAHGKWVRDTLPSAFAGFQTSRFRSTISDKQRKWWKNAAVKHGLDASDDVLDRLTGREFTALPVLSDLKVKI